MKHSTFSHKIIFPGIPLKLLNIVIVILFFASSSAASQFGFFGPPSDFINSNLAVRTDTGIEHLSIRLIDF